MNLWLISLFWFYMEASSADANIIVQLSNKKGKIQGHILKSGNGKDYYAFQEIPYATPPTGQYRFKEPKEPKDWKGILKTTMNKKVCMQNVVFAYTKPPETMEITEDCLYLNVYTPVKPGTKGKSMPVLFWIHAGAFFYGSGAYQYYNPRHFMDAGIVVVAMNYRLGPLGFLTTADGVIPANLGLKDTVFAFEWVIKNIHLFGGDPKRITVAGGSAGAFSAGYLQLSKKLRGQVRGFILESGSPLSPVAVQDDPRHFAFALGKVLNSNFKSNDSKNLLDELMKASPLDIVMANVEDERDSANIIKSIIWGPIIENRNNPNAVVTRPMHEALMKGDFTRVPLLTGFCTEESRYFLKGLTEEAIGLQGRKFDQNISLMISPRLHVTKNDLRTACTQYKSIYTNKTFQSNPGIFLKYVSDDTFTTPVIRHAELASKFSNVFLYQFSYQGRMDGFASLPNVTGADTVAHTAELKYLFEGLEGYAGKPTDYSISDQLTLKRMLELWTNFIKYQNPTPTSNKLLNNVIWPLVKGDNIQYLNIGSTLRVQSNPKFYKGVKRVFLDYIQPPLVVF